MPISLNYNKFTSNSSEKKTIKIDDINLNNKIYSNNIFKNHSITSINKNLNNNSGTNPYNNTFFSNFTNFNFNKDKLFLKDKEKEKDEEKKSHISFGNVKSLNSNTNLN